MSAIDFSKYPPEVLNRFKKFHKENPQVYEEFVNTAKRMKRTGRTRYSARTIIEVLRWTRDIGTTGEVFKINDDYVPIYVRLLIHNYPEFNGFFELRKIRSGGFKSSEQREREDHVQEN